MCHGNAPLTPTGRLRLAWCVVEDGRPLRRAAERFQVSHTTAKRWADRYRLQGWAGMYDRSSRPHHSPRKTATAVEEQVVRMRQEHRIGPLRLAVRTGVAPSTAHRILREHGLPPLAALDRATGRPVRRYERTRPGELVHIDVKKLGRIPDGGGHRMRGRAAGQANRKRSTAGYAYLHTALDDHSRLAYTEDLADETAPTCAAFLKRAAAWFAARGIVIERVLTDNAWAYSKNTWRQTCRQLGISPRWTRPWRPQTNGKVERFHRTLLEEWAYHQPYTSDTERQAAFPAWLDWYNYHRPHTGISGRTPASRVTNLSKQHT
ncbi:IS481 family transposase [Streptomyces ruber]|uniref:IS481 family transposase n=2 Tax=Streptomyces TaxID=1883 RepID=A0A918ER56_9ACTN|nr:IS481 family transposase [Streptomyces ruber]GGQ48207.1 IS481 family transposase [Streptomyces ruber]